MTQNKGGTTVKEEKNIEKNGEKGEKAPLCFTDVTIECEAAGDSQPFMVIITCIAQGLDRV